MLTRPFGGAAVIRWGEPLKLPHKKVLQMSEANVFETPCPSAVRDVNKNITSHFTRGQHRHI